MRQPKVADCVHYYISDEPRAAIVTEIREENICSLAIFYPNSISFAAYCPYSADRIPGSWCFPEDVNSKTTEFGCFPENSENENSDSQEQLPSAPLPLCPSAPLPSFTPF